MGVGWASLYVQDRTVGMWNAALWSVFPGLLLTVDKRLLVLRDEDVLVPSVVPAAMMEAIRPPFR